MERGAWQATVHGGHDESYTTERLSLTATITASTQFSWEVQADVIYKNGSGKEKETKL